MNTPLHRPGLDGDASPAIRITVNGETRDIPPGSSLDELIRRVGLDGRPCAAEVNGRLVPRAIRDGVRLEPGDRVELVTLVGGG